MQALATAALTLEPLTAGHAEAMFTILREPALHRHLEHPPPASVEQLRAHYARLETRRSPSGQQLWLNWIVRPHGEAPIGYVQATVVPVRRLAWIGYVLSRCHWGRGHATAATRAMIEHLVEAYGVERFLATVEWRNRRSVRVLERLGFRPATSPELQGHALSPTERLYVRAASAERAGAPRAAEPRAHARGGTMSEELPDAVRRVRRALAEAGIAARVVRLPQAARTAPDAAAALGCHAGQIAKSLVFRRTDTDGPVLIIASGANRVDERLAAAHLAADIAKADASFVRAASGYAIGGVPPIGHAVPPETLIDRELLQYDTVWAAAGTPHTVFAVDPRELVRATGGRVLELAASA
jgi:prolyl-tRNA editing enzyme YbaK/EbsC (Cys-tRNA(Pro) deacylase)/RimJ/RimL family protein N-acetyltransferase